MSHPLLVHFFHGIAFFLLLALHAPSHAQVALTGTLGGQHLSSDNGFRADAGLYYKLDGQSLVGGLYQRVPRDGSAHHWAGPSAFIRLPLGRVVVPVVTGSLAFLSIKMQVKLRFGVWEEAWIGKMDGIAAFYCLVGGKAWAQSKALAGESAFFLKFNGQLTAISKL